MMSGEHFRDFHGTLRVIPAEAVRAVDHFESGSNPRLLQYNCSLWRLQWLFQAACSGWGFTSRLTCGAFGHKRSSPVQQHMATV